jgi:hypothetical protein
MQNSTNLQKVQKKKYVGAAGAFSFNYIKN